MTNNDEVVLRKNRKTIIYTIILVIVFFILLSSSISFILIGTYTAIEDDEVISRADRLQVSLNESIENLKRAADDYAVWDEMAEYVLFPTRKFEEMNLVDKSFIDLGLDIVGVYDKNLNPLYLHDFTQNETNGFPLDPAMEDYLIQAIHRMVPDGESSPENAGFIFQNGTRAGIIVVRPITYHTTDTQTGGVLIMARFFSEPFVKKLSIPFKSRLQVFLSDEEKIPGITELSRDEPVIVIKNETDITSIIAISDRLSGKKTLFQLTSPRTIYQQGLSTLFTYLLVIAFLIGVFSFLIVIAIQYYFRHTRQIIMEVRRKDSSYQNLLNSQGTAFFRLDFSGIIQEISPGGISMLGFTDQSEIIGKRLSDFYQNPDDSEKLRGILLKEKEIKNYPVVVKRKDGSLTFVTANAHLLFSNTGEVIGFEGVVHDQTERILTGKALEETEQQYRLLYEGTNIGIFQSTPDGKLHSCNPAFSRILGYSSPEQMKTEIWDLAEDVYANPDDRNILLDLINQKGIVENYEVLFRRRGREPVWVTLNSVVIRDKESRLVFFLSTVININDKKKAESALQASEEKYRVVADNTYDWEFWRDQDGIFRYVSPSCMRISGYQAEQFLADDTFFSRIIYPDDQAIWSDHENPENDREHGSLELRIIHADGSIRWIQHIWHPVISPDGRYLGKRGSNRDITEKKEIEVALKESEEKYRSIFSQSPVAILIHSWEGVVLDANATAMELFNISSSDLASRMPMSHHIISRDEYQELISGASIEKEIKLDSSAFSRDNGTPAGIGSRYLHVIVTPVPHPTIPDNGWLLAHIRDISALKESLQALTRSELRLREAEKISHVGHWELDNRNNILIWSDEVYDIFEIPVEEEIRTYDLFLDKIHPEDRDFVSELFDLHLREKKPFDIIHRILTPGGRIKYVREICRTEWSRLDTPVRTLGIIQDITSLKESEQALIASEGKYQSVVSSLSEGIFVQDEQGLIITWNKSAEIILGISFAESDETEPGKFWEHFSQPDGKYLGDQENPARTALSSGKTTRIPRLLFRREDGRNVWISLTAQPMDSAGQNVMQVVCSMTDITNEVRDSQARDTLLDLYQNADLISTSGIMKYGLQACQMVTGSRKVLLSVPDPAVFQMLDRETGPTEEPETGFQIIPPDAMYEYPGFKTCFSTRRPVIHNRIPASSSEKTIIEPPFSEREIVVPVLEREDVVAMVAVSGKNWEYDQDDINAITLVFGNIWTIIRHRLAEQMIRENELKYRLMFNNVSLCLALYEVSPSGRPDRILDLNPKGQEMFQKTTSEIIESGDSLHSFFRWPDSEGAGPVDPLSGHPFETTLLQISGSELPVLMTLNTFQINARPVGLAIIEDLSMKKTFEKERIDLINQIEKNMTEMAILNDGIRNPLTVILMLSNALPEEDQKKIRYHILDIDQLINQLDRRWIESEKILKFLQKHYNLHYR